MIIRLLRGLRSWFVRAAHRVLAAALAGLPYRSQRVRLSGRGFDYVVVGGGSAGCVLAARLSEDPAVTVLLLEAGREDDSPLIPVPACSLLLQRTAWDWAFRTEPQTASSKALQDGVSFWPRGKTLGGSSSVNYMAFVRGHRADFDSWERDHGAEGWGWAGILPYFKRMEHCVLPGTDPALRGNGGPLQVQGQVSPRPISSMFLRACEAQGIPNNPDYNGAEQLGAALFQTTIKAGRRCSTSAAYLRPSRRRPNLTVATRCLVHRVLFEEGGAKPQATGVAFSRGGRENEETVLARREVVLSAGAVGSPHILQLSGVGPAEHLLSHGINPVVDLQGVGSNLQDHIFSVLPFATSAETVGLHCLTPKHLMAYLLRRSGPLASNLIEATAFIETGVRQDLCGAPDIQLHFLAATGNSFDLDNINLGKGWQAQLDMRQRSYSILPTLLHPRSTGTVRLRSRSPRDAPSIQPRYLEHPDDVASLKAGLELANRLAQEGGEEGQGLRDVTIGPLFQLSTLDGHPAGSEAYWEAWVRHFTVTVYHPTSSCKMGGPRDPARVVDPNLCVVGCEGLRVVDASVMPAVVSGNTNAAVIAIAEKAADLISMSYASRGRSGPGG